MEKLTYKEKHPKLKNKGDKHLFRIGNLKNKLKSKKNL